MCFSPTRSSTLPRPCFRSLCRSRWSFLFARRVRFLKQNSSGDTILLIIVLSCCFQSRFIPQTVVMIVFTMLHVEPCCFIFVFYANKLREIIWRYKLRNNFRQIGKAHIVLKCSNIDRKIITGIHKLKRWFDKNELSLNFIKTKV